MKKKIFIWLAATAAIYAAAVALMQSGVSKTFFPPMPVAEIAMLFPLHFLLCGLVAAFALWLWKRR